MSKTTEKLEREIASKQKELDELVAALRVIRRFEGEDVEDESPGEREESKLPLTDSGEIDLAMLELPEKSSRGKPTTQDLVREVVDKFGSKEFTVSHVYAALLQLGKITESKHAKNRLSMAIRKLSDEHVVELTHKGAGNDPHRYKVAKEPKVVRFSGTGEPH